MAAQAPGTTLSTIDDYQRAGRFNVLTPVLTITGDAVSPVLVESISVVQINPSKDSGETYHDFRYANERDGKHALTSLALSKIAAAAGIKWVPQLCVQLARERRADGHVYILVQAAGAIRQPNGEWHVEIATKEIDTQDVAEQLRDNDRRTLKRAREARGNSGPKWTQALVRATDEQVAEVIEDRVRQQILQLREHLNSHAETKARSRVIRKVLSLKQTYTDDELKQPFAVPRLLFRPDLMDPVQLEQVQIDGARAARDIFGAAEEPGTRAPGPVTAAPELPGGNVPDTAPVAPASPAAHGASEAEDTSGGAPAPAGVANPSAAGDEPAGAVSTTSTAQAAGGEDTSDHRSEDAGSTPAARSESSTTEGAPAQIGGASDSQSSGDEKPDAAPDAEAGGLGRPADAEGTASDAPRLNRPDADPIVSSGPHAGKRFSEIAIENPEWLRGMAAETKAITRKRLAEDWLNYIAVMGPPEAAS